MSRPALRPGVDVDHYRVMRLLGRGGMGEVYLARDAKLGRKVALKVIRPERLASPRAMARFLREARTTAKFSHPNIVAIYGVGEHRGTPYVALEYLEGENLSERLNEQVLSAPEAIRIGLAVAEALEEAHRHGVLHRDLKPANVLLGRDGRVRVLDFGLAASVAAVADEQEEPATHLDTGSFEVGTPLYMAPEQWHRELGSDRTDVWALGLILFEAVTGRLPHEPARSSAPPEPGDPASWLGGTALPPPTGPDEQLERLRTAVTSSEPLPGIAAVHGAELAQLVARCLQKDASKRPSAAEVAVALRALQRGARLAAQSPFRGLLPYTEEQAALFFGRDAELDAFAECVRHDPVLAVVGPSGVGKSSFVQAGVIPRLREQGPWHVLRIRPGPRPLATLAASILKDASDLSTTSASSGASSDASDPPRESMERVRRGESARAELRARIAERPRELSLELRSIAARLGVRVLLFVDQLEELFTMGRDEGETKAFIEAVCTASDDASDPIRVIFAVRDDFLGRLAVSAAAREVLTRVTLIKSMDPAELRAVLEKPVEAFGYRFEDARMVDQMVDAAGAEPSSLPLVQFAAHQLWEQRDDERRLLLRAAYDAMGGVEGALAKHADGVLDAFDPPELAVARELLLRLVTPDRTRRMITRRAALEALGEVGERVLTQLVGARLLVARKAHRSGERAHLELAHESLIRSWATLSRWIDESKEELLFLSEAQQAAELWDRRGRRADELWQDEALHEAERMRARLTTQMPTLLEEFLAASQVRAARARRRRRWLTASLTSLLVAVAAGATIAALLIAAKEREARSERDRAEAESREAVHRHAEALREAAGAALNEGRLLEARAKLRMALELEDTQPARALWWRLESDPLVWEKSLGALIYEVAVSPDGRTVAAASQDQAIYLLDTRSQAVRVLRGHRDQVMAVSYAPDAPLLASGGWEGAIHLWSTETAERRYTVEHPSGVRCLRFGAGGALISAGYDDSVRIWKLTGAAAPALQVMVALEGCDIKRIDVHDNKLAVTCEQATVQLFDATTGKREATLEGHEASVRGVAFNHDGTRLASASGDGTVRIWSLKEKRATTVLRGHRSGVFAVAFSPDGRWLASAGNDHTVRLWDAATSRTVRLYLGHRALVASLAFSPDGALLASAGRDGNVRLWDNAHGRAEASPGSHTDSVYGVGFRPDGAALATASRDGTVRLWDVASGVDDRLLEGAPEGLREVQYSPDGTLIAAAGYDNRVRIWKADAVGEPRVVADHGDAIYGLAFDPRGELLASGSYDRTLRLIDPSSGRTVGVLRGHEGGIRDVRFSPDGRLVGSAGIDGTVRLWDVSSKSELRQLGRHGDAAHTLAFSPDGAHVGSGGVDGAVRMWSVGGAEEPSLGRHNGRIYGMVFHPDGQRLATAASDGTARIWSFDGKPELVLRGHRGEVNAVAFSPDGELLATGSDDHTVRLWRTRDGRPAWRAPVLLGAPPRLLTHAGWLALDQRGATVPDTRWRALLEKSAATAAANGDQLCVYTHAGKLEQWSMSRDERLSGGAAPSLVSVVATPSSCAAIGGGRAWILTAKGMQSLELDDATALGMHEGRLLVAGATKVHLFDEQGARLGAVAAGAGATAVAVVGDGLAVGYRDGNVELTPLEASADAPRSLQRTPSSPVVRILAGPASTVVVGYANGVLGLYSLADGGRLAEVHLHGPVSHLLLEGHRLYAATELGRHLAWDLDALHGDWCAVLENVWRRVPVVWSEGRAVLSEPPSTHACRSR